MLWVFIILILLIILRNVVIVPQAAEYVIERLGVYSTTWDAGLHIKIPIIDRISKRVSIKEQVADFDPQPVITKDNVTMQIDTVVFYQVFDAKLYTYGVVNPINAIDNLTATTLRNIIGDMELDATLSSRDVINTKITASLDEATDKWGIKINRVELKNIIPPKEIQNAMEKQMKAERERRESILRAEGEKKAAILSAEGEKESAILRAEAQKEQLIKEAEGHAESIRLHKQAEADGLKLEKEAEAEAIKMLVNAGLSSEQIITLRSHEAFIKASEGKANKIIIPSDVQNLARKTSIVKELLK